MTSNAGERALVLALEPWEWRLALHEVRRWLMRGVLVAAGAACLVLAAGWVLPLSAAELRPFALAIAAAVVMAALVRGAWPVPTARRAGELDERLGLADRLATAWAHRTATRPMARLQRADALARLAECSPQRDLALTWPRGELAALGAVLLVALVFLLAPSPMQGLLRQRAAEQLAVEETASRLEALRQELVEAPSLTPEQVRELDELLLQAQQDLARTRGEQEAAAVLARAARELTRLSELAADNREEALAAMSETLTREPLARPLGEALQHGDAPAAGDSLRALAEHADELSDAQRRALARALQRAANLGRGDPRSADALREAARALSEAGEDPGPSLQAASAALEAAVQLANAQSALRSATPRPPETGAETGRSGTLGSADLPANQGQPGVAPPTSSEDVFVPGNPSADLSLSDVVQQPVSVRGQPRRYRDVLAQYAQGGRDYVERANVPPNVRELVKHYFDRLQEQ